MCWKTSPEMCVFYSFVSTPITKIIKLNIATDYIVKENYWTPDDSVYLEDESGRILIKASDEFIRDHGDFVTG